MTKQRRYTFGALALIALLFVALMWRGHCWPLAPHTLVRWWALRVVPLGTPYAEARKKIAAHGWHEVSISGSCAERPGLGDWTICAEAGQLLMESTFVTYHFNSLCQLDSADIEDEANVP